MFSSIPQLSHDSLACRTGREPSVVPSQTAKTSRLSIHSRICLDLQREEIVYIKPAGWDAHVWMLCWKWTWLELEALLDAKHTLKNLCVDGFDNSSHTWGIEKKNSVSVYMKLLNHVDKRKNGGGRWSEKGVKKQWRCQNSFTAIWWRRSLFSILLNWPVGLIIPLAGFRCHTVWAVVVIVMGWGGTEGNWRLRRG